MSVQILPPLPQERPANTGLFFLSTGLPRSRRIPRRSHRTSRSNRFRDVRRRLPGSGLVPPVRRCPRPRGSRTRARVCRPRRRHAAAARRQALRCRDRSPLPRRRPHLDFVNKALETLYIAGWDRAEAVLASLPAQLAGAARMEEANAWRNPIDLIDLLKRAFDRRPRAVAGGKGRQGGWDGRRALVETVLDGKAAAILDALLEALREGASEVELASAVAFAAATRIARFPTSNEFGDWDTALHTFSFANAVEQGLRRSPSPELLRGVLDAAISVHLDRFLNVPATRLPTPEPAADPGALLDELPRLFDRQQQVDEARQLVASFLAAGRPARQARRRARRRPRRREPELPHDPVCRGGAAPARPARRQRRRGAAAARRGRLPRCARDNDPLAAPDIRDRATPPPRREALRGRGSLSQHQPEKGRGMTNETASEQITDEVQRAAAAPIRPPAPHRERRDRDEPPTSHTNAARSPAAA